MTEALFSSSSSSLYVITVDKHVYYHTQPFSLSLCTVPRRKTRRRIGTSEQRGCVRQRHSGSTEKFFPLLASSFFFPLPLMFGFFWHFFIGSFFSSFRRSSSSCIGVFLPRTTTTTNKKKKKKKKEEDQSLSWSPRLSSSLVVRTRACERAMKRHKSRSTNTTTTTTTMMLIHTRRRRKDDN